MEQRQNNERKSHRHPQLNAGQQVYVQDEKTELWEPGTVTQTTAEPKSYLVESADDNIHQKNRQFLRPARADLTKSLYKNRHNRPLTVDTDALPNGKMMRVYPINLGTISLSSPKLTSSPAAPAYSTPVLNVQAPLTSAWSYPD